MALRKKQIVIKSQKLTDYAPFLAELKARVLNARTGAARAVNHELILLYWDIGKGIVDKQRTSGWGDSVVEKLAADLRAAFPDMTGFSARNIWDIRRFYCAYSDPAFLRQVVAESGKTAVIKFLRQVVAEMPWGHHLLLLNKVSDASARFYYLRASAQLGWSRSVLLNQIRAKTYNRARKEKKSHNFVAALPEHFAEQAGEMIKSRYNLEFLGLRRAVKERELEGQLVTRLQQFILELGYGFCFVGRQYRLALGSKEYFVDLLFYHRFLKALVAFDLKIDAFEPEHAGKMDFYLNLLNARERGKGDRPSIGIILCAEKDDIEVEFALKSKGNPIGVAEYQLQPRLPAEFKGKLPTVKQLTEVMRTALPRRK